jgi:hypothetical protein
MAEISPEVLATFNHVLEFTPANTGKRLLAASAWNRF